MSGRPKGPLGIDPLHFSAVLFGVLLCFVMYLLLPRGFRKQYFGAYPKRHAWSARQRSSHPSSTSSRGGRTAGRSSYTGTGNQSLDGSYTGGSSLGAGTAMTGPAPNPGAGGSAGGSHRQLHQGLGLAGVAPSQQQQQQQQQQRAGVGGYNDEEQVDFIGGTTTGGQQQQQQPLMDMQHQQQQQNDEIVISAAMQQLRDPGVLIVAHGSRGKPKTVRLQLTESAITWRTETRKKSADGGKTSKPKMGKLHQVPLSHIMYVDVGKQTTALRRVENASVSELLCFSLLTKEGSLDLEANSPRERDALVSCFSLVLDEVHAQNWRDIYRGPSSDMPSSFDEIDHQQQQQQQQQDPGGQTAGGVGGMKDHPSK